MELPVSLDPSGRQSLQRQLFEQLRGLILGAGLRPGTPVPPSRLLARQLGVSRNTVVLAYERLSAEGYLQTRSALGTYVSHDLPDSSLRVDADGIADRMSAGRRFPRSSLAFRGRAQAVVSPGKLEFDFWLGRLDPTLFPLSTWRRLVNQVLERADSGFTEYRDPTGLFELRAAIADHLRPARGMKVESDQIIVVAGAQQGLNLIARLLLREGTRVVTENPSYQGAAYLFESYRAEVIPVPVDENGLCVDALPPAGAALVHLTPSHQYPMGFTLSLERRMRLLDWARQTGAYVVEDDYDSDFRYRDSPVAALMGLDSHDCVIYIGTFSKSLGPGLRLGYLVVPRHLAGPARAVKTLLDNGRPWLEQAVLSSFIATGGYTNHLRRIRQSYAERREHLMECLRRHFGETKVSGAECGMHIAWHLPQDLPRAPVLQTMAAERDVGIYTLRSGAVCDFGGCAYSERTILLGFSSLNERQIRRGVEGIAAAVDASHCCGGNV